MQGTHTHPWKGRRAEPGCLEPGDGLRMDFGLALAVLPSLRLIPHNNLHICPQRSTLSHAPAQCPDSAVPPRRRTHPICTTPSGSHWPRVATDVLQCGQYPRTWVCPLTLVD